MKAPGFAQSADSNDAITERASAYFERRRFEAWSDADQAEFEAWLAQSILHEVAYLRLEGTVAEARELFALRARPAEGRTGSILNRRFVLPLLAAASIAMFAALGIPYVNSLMQSPDRTYATEVGGRTLLNFADHTQIALNTDTVVRFRMTASERTVWLEKGEAWFDVSHNAANPFTVVVGKHRVTDLGTEFLIRRDPDRMEVALLNGRATLSAEGAPTTVLAPGDDALATPAALTVTRKTPQELADALAWRRGMLVFRETRLEDAVREFNRYNQTKLVIVDPSIADLKVSVVVKNDNFEGFLHVAQAMLNLRADWQGKNILLSRAAGKQNKAGAAP